MTDYRHRIPVDWHTVLQRVLERARAAGEKGLLIFDLDSTVFDNRPRQARIMREYGRLHGIAALERCQAHHVTGWELKAIAMNCGLPEGQVTTMYKDLRAYWASKFFTSEYCEDDVETVGSPRYLKACWDTGATIVYVTGRHEAMRAGTLKCLAKCQLPVPGTRARLLMKPAQEESDDAYKRYAHGELERMGEVLAAFDNEPIHIADYAKRFPGAQAVHLATDNSGREVPLSAAIVSIPHFAF